QSPFTILGFPTAATRISAPLQTASKFLVFECAVVTVQFSANNNCAIGFPNNSDLPITTAFNPSRDPSPLREREGPGVAWAEPGGWGDKFFAASFIRISAPCGVQGTIPSSPATNRPIFVTVSPSTSLRGSIICTNSSASRCPGRGSCNKIPCTFGLSL